MQTYAYVKKRIGIGAAPCQRLNRAKGQPERGTLVLDPRVGCELEQHRAV
jgi:hypothetical protein